MLKLAKPWWAWTVLAVFLAAFVTACAPKTLPNPKVQSLPSQFPYNVNDKGLAIAVVPFDGQRDVYADPANPRPVRPDFDWLKAGVRPTRIILANDSPQAVLVDPSQVTCIDNQGVVHQAYTTREAVNAVVASQAFGAHVRSGLRRGLAGAALGAGVGAALGSVSSYGGYAAAGAAAGAAWWSRRVVITVQVSETSFPSPQGRTALCSAARTGSRSCFFPDGAFSQLSRDPSGSQPRSGPSSKPRLMPSFMRAMTCPPASRIAMIRS